MDLANAVQKVHLRSSSTLTPLVPTLAPVVLPGDGYAPQKKSFFSKLFGGAAASAPVVQPQRGGQKAPGCWLNAEEQSGCCCLWCFHADDNSFMLRCLGIPCICLDKK